MPFACPGCGDGGIGPRSNSNSVSGFCTLGVSFGIDLPERFALGPELAHMEIHKRHQAQGTKPVETPVFHEPDFVLVQDHRPPPRIELARERMLMCRLYLGLIRSMTEDYGAVFAAHNDSSTFRTIGIYVFLRTVMCSPVSASRIAHALKLPRVIVVRRLQEMVKHGYVERVGNAYRVTDKVNIPDLKIKLQRRMDMIVETARKLSELNSSPELGPVANEDVQASRTSVI